MLTSHIERGHQPNVLKNLLITKITPKSKTLKNNKIIVREKQKHSNNPNVSTLENHRHVIIGSSNVGKTY